jgi:hypothetical protein
MPLQGAGKREGKEEREGAFFFYVKGEIYLYVL